MSDPCEFFGAQRHTLAGEDPPVRTAHPRDVFDPQGSNNRGRKYSATSPTWVASTRIAVYVLAFEYWNTRPRDGRRKNSSARSGQSVIIVSDHGRSIPLDIVNR